MSLDGLTKKQKGFVKDYIETGNGTKSALKNYDTDDENTASTISSENLRKPTVINAIKSLGEQIPDSLIVDKLIGLLNQKQLNYFVFPKKMEDEEIKEHLKANGLDTIVVRESDKGKMAFYSIDDANAIKGAIDMTLKMKGAYTEDKQKDINILMPVLVKFLNKKDDETSDNGDTNRIQETI